MPQTISQHTKNKFFAIIFKIKDLMKFLLKGTYNNDVIAVILS